MKVKLTCSNILKYSSNYIHKKQWVGNFQPWLTLTLKMLVEQQNSLCPKHQHHQNLLHVVVFMSEFTCYEVVFWLSVAYCVRPPYSDLCLNTGMYKASMSSCLPAMMDDSLATCIDLVTPGQLFLLFVMYRWLTSRLQLWIQFCKLLLQ